VPFSDSEGGTQSRAKASPVCVLEGGGRDNAEGDRERINRSEEEEQQQKSASTGQQQHGMEALWTGRCEIRQMSFFGAEEGWGGKKKTVGVGDVPFRFLFLSRQKEWRFRRQSKAKKGAKKESPALPERERLNRHTLRSHRAHRALTSRANRSKRASVNKRRRERKARARTVTREKCWLSSPKGYK
jgi:glycerol-3-phosphate O-acyltransferase